MKGEIHQQMIIRCSYNVVCVPLVALFSWQQATDLAAMTAHCGISPNRYGSLSMFDLFSNSLWVYNLWEICVPNVVVQLAGG